MSEVDAHVHLIVPVLLVIELALLCQICDLRFKFEEDRTKTAVAIESDRYFGRTEVQTNTRMIIYLSNAMNCIGQTTNLTLVA